MSYLVLDENNLFITENISDSIINGSLFVLLFSNKDDIDKVIDFKFFEKIKHSINDGYSFLIEKLKKANIKVEKVRYNSRLANDIFYFRGNQNTIVFQENIVKLKYDVGFVCQHCDGDGNHQFLPLKSNGDFYIGLMVTSHPGWSNKFRKITEDESNHFMIANSKISYLALTSVPKSEIHNLKYKFPKYRIKELIEEFL